ncbi:MULTISPECIES: hypothetical protein [Halobaculum]|uniref:Uncharacterized protein n=2 Tax=Halobaculum TaxID=43927 RepID=A0A8T8WCR4_9EURY|nr:MULTISPECIES: hypothetical protein [Halobaculum]QZP37586.1 hypothetical protein K6T50_15150 [Halobaculum magnesiiphilum]QZY02603.1 hypothetical protein K6T36_15150 [Halobaculum roseum]
MSLKGMARPNGDAIDQVAGITGLGWTASLLGYLSTVIGYSNSLITNPQTLLYVGSVFFVTTLGLDRLRSRLSNDE